MIVQSNFLKKVKDLGLNTYEAKLWAALLSRGVSTAGELSDIANVPRSRSYDVLESLERKGFIIMKIAKPIKYLAVPPDEVLERVKRRISDEAEEKHQMMDEIKASTVLDELNLLHSQGIKAIDPQDITGSIKGRSNIYNHLDYLIKESKKNITIVTSEDGLLRKHKALKKSLTKANKKGVKINFIVPLTLKSKNIISDVQKIASVTNKDLNGRICLFDDSQVVFMLSDDKDVHPSFDTCVWITSPYFTGLVLSNLIQK